jgi:hypothetical protein
MTRSEAIRILEIVKVEKPVDITQEDKGNWSFARDGSISLDNHTFSSYDELIDYLETIIEETSGGYCDDFR